MDDDTFQALIEGMSDAKRRLLEIYREHLASLEVQLDDLRSGRLRFFRGDEDATADAIALAERQHKMICEVLERELGRKD